MCVIFEIIDNYDNLILLLKKSYKYLIWWHDILLKN